MPQSIIKITNLTKDYGSKKGVFHLTFDVKKGEIMGFLGPNGAGKTTTIRQLMGFIRPNEGSVTIKGMDCYKEAHKIQDHLGYLPGEIAFMDDMNGKEFIRFIGNMKGMKAETRAKELIEFFELDTNGRIEKMSKGMKQKIGLVCAFMNNPDILILDEPTSGLDPLMQNKFVSLLLEEKKKGKTILMSSHIFEEIEKTCDRTVIIKEGEIVAIEEMEELRKNKKKKFEFVFEKEKEAREFVGKYPGAQLEQKTVTLLTGGNIDCLLKEVSKYTIKDINIKLQTLEELFMNFYGGNEHDK